MSEMTRQEAETHFRLLSEDCGIPVAVCTMLGRPDWATLWYTIPERMHHGLAHWVLFGRPSGDFLMSVIRNDLMGALGRADDENRRLIWEYCNVLHNAAPCDCYGHANITDTWRGVFPAVEVAEVADGQ